MALFSKKKTAPATVGPHDKASSTDTTTSNTPATESVASLPEQHNNHVATQPLETPSVTLLAILLGSIASIGGFMFGYESGQISGMSLHSRVTRSQSLTILGFLQMADFLDRFGENGKFSAARQGTIVGLLCIGTLLGCLFSGWLCDRIGRRYTISSSAFFYIIGVVIEITSSTHWVQFAMGRFTYVFFAFLSEQSRW
jgi:MFS transporter, SP family, sugar:H+ symporter